MLTELYIKMLSYVTCMKSRKGQTLVEYGLILALVSIVVIAVLIALGSQLNSVFGKITATLSSVTT